MDDLFSKFDDIVALCKMKRLYHSEYLQRDNISSLMIFVAYTIS